MKIPRIISVLLTFSLLPLCALASNQTDGVKDEIPYTPHDAKYAAYSHSKMDVYTEGDAPEDVPRGFSGYVMRLEGENSASGITVDFSDREIPASIIKSLRMRVYYPSVTKEVRITIDAGLSWVMRYEAKKPDEWNDITLEGAELSKLMNGNGNLGKFGFGFRYYSGNFNTVSYIDFVSVEFTETDTNPPVITYDGKTDVTMTAGKPLLLNATAYDEDEKREVNVKTVWEDGALDGDGLPVKGVHVCYLTAKDSFGNKSEIKLNVTVTDKDTEAPVINFGCTEINTVTGCIPALKFTASDNEDDAAVIQRWSDGALDRSGRLTQGEHELTLSSTDLTGNKTEMIIKVNVKEKPE